MPEMPISAAPPNTVCLDDLFAIVNTILNFDEGYEFDKGSAEVWEPIPGIFDGVVYHFDRELYEAVFFVDDETEKLLDFYLRLLWISHENYLGLLSVAGAFLKALEPNLFEYMLEEILSFNYEEYETTEQSEKSATGEYWTIVVSFETMVTIFPAR